MSLFKVPLVFLPKTCAVPVLPLTAIGNPANAPVPVPPVTTSRKDSLRNLIVAFVAGNQVWFSTRIKASAVSGTKAFYVGLRNGSAVTNGLWFAKAASSTSVNLVSTVASVSTTLATGVATAVDDTFLELGYYFDGLDLLVYSDNVVVARVSAPVIGTNIPSVNLGTVMQITPTATDTLTVDYISASVEVTR